MIGDDAAAVLKRERPGSNGGNSAGSKIGGWLFKLLLDLLRSRGWLPAQVDSSLEIEKAIARFQAWAGLEQTGEIDPKTIAALDAPRFCGLPDVMEQRSGLCKWPDNRIAYHVVDAFPGLTIHETWESFDWSMKQWASVCDLKPNRALTPETARIVARVVRLDGPSGVLADSQLPCGAIRQAQQRYDSSEAWNRAIQARLVVLHELGHALGIPHIGSGNVMAPVYDPRLTALQRGDAAEAVERYGKPVDAPAPQPTPPATSEGGPFFFDHMRKVVVAPVGWRLETRPI